MADKDPLRTAVRKSVVMDSNNSVLAFWFKNEGLEEGCDDGWEVGWEDGAVGSALGA